MGGFAGKREFNTTVMVPALLLEFNDMLERLNVDDDTAVVVRLVDVLYNHATSV